MWRGVQPRCAAGPVSVVGHDTSWDSTIVSALKVKLAACSSITHKPVLVLTNNDGEWVEDANGRVKQDRQSASKWRDRG